MRPVSQVSKSIRDTKNFSLICSKYYRCSTTLNVGVLQHFPEIADAMLKRDWTFVNHGFYNTRYITAFSEEQEREFFERCRETFRSLTGRELRGKSGPPAPQTR